MPPLTELYLFIQGNPAPLTCIYVIFYFTFIQSGNSLKNMILINKRILSLQRITYPKFTHTAVNTHTYTHREHTPGALKE